jgi:hypothetical protein
MAGGLKCLVEMELVLMELVLEQDEALVPVADIVEEWAEALVEDLAEVED